MNIHKFGMIAALAALILFSGCAGTGQAVGTQAAASGQHADASQADTPQAAGTPGASDQPRELSQAMKLALGTLKLEGTQNAVTAEQAAELLPLWKAARSLGGSQTAAAEEIQSVFKQIEKAMTSEQMSAIDAMQISMEDLGAIADELGLQMGGPANADLGMQATMQAVRATAQASGEMPGSGGGPGGAGGPPPGGPMGGEMGGGPGGIGANSGLSEEARATAMAQRGSRGAQVGVPTPLVEAIIQLLEAK